MTEDELILTHILQCPRSELYLQKLQLTSSQQQQFESTKARRKNGEPLQYVLGCCEFYGLEFKVDKRVLIPRPETEVLVELAIKRVAERGAVRILDLGTGSGNIAIALAKLLPGALVTTVDISSDALDLAKENAKIHGVEKRINFICADMLSFVILSAAKDLKEHLDSSASPQNDSNLFDVIISNPPYIPKAQIKILPVDVQREPALALEAGEDGLKFYRDIIKYTPPLLREEGYLMMEFGDGQDKPIQALFDSDFKVGIFKDLAGKERFLIAGRV